MTELIPDEEGFTELVDPNVPRVDLVDRPANGAPGWLLLKQDQQTGLMSPDTIRDLIGKVAAEPESAADKVTMTGSPAAIAKLMYEAAQRSRKRDEALTYEEIVKAKYDADDLKRMAANGEAMADESYPIADQDDLDRAIRAVGRGGADHDAIRRHIIRRAKALGAKSEIPDNWAADGSLKEVSKMAVTGELDDDVDVNAMDATVVLADPETDAPGDVNEPGSPAWEAVDAATARKWISIAVRLRNALCVMAEREMLEAASADPDDIESAWDLQDAECALDYVIDTLAGFAVEEQAEAELSAEAMEMVGKALADFDTTPLDTFEALAPVTKAGRTLSAANEAAIRDAVDSLQKVLASLPAAPTTEEVAKTANEEPNMPESTLSEDVTADSGQEPAMGIQEPMAKASSEKTPMVAVYDSEGNLVGIVDPSEITPISGAGSKKDDTTSGEAEEADAAPETPDLEPAPAAEVGTPADAIPDNEDDVAKSTTHTPSDEVLKSIVEAQVAAALADFKATQEQTVAKQADDRAQLADTVETLKARVEALEEQPAMPKVFTTGAAPRDLRGLDAGTPAASDIAKAAQLKKSLMASTDAGEQRDIARQMQEQARAVFDRLQPRG